MKTLMIGLTSPLDGGSQRHIYELSSNIPNCEVLTQRGTLCKNKITLPIISKPSFLMNLSFFFVALIYSIKLLFFKKHQIIHIHENLCYFLIPLLRIRYKVIVTIHGINGFKFYDNKFFWFFFKSMLLTANQLIAVNLEDEKRLKKYFKKVTYLPNGVDLTLYKKIKPKIENKISFIGRIHEQKGVVYLLEAFSKIVKKFPSFKLELIGEINDYAKQLQKKFPSKKIVWRGAISDRKEIIRSLKSAYCIVLPSLWEGLPLTLFESLATKRPVILSDIPAFKSVIKDQALFFKVKDSQDLANKLQEVIKDKIKANALGEKGEKLSRQYTWKKIAKKLEEVYENV